jgi:hypothetical protein
MQASIRLMTKKKKKAYVSCLVEEEMLSKEALERGTWQLL